MRNPFALPPMPPWMEKPTVLGRATKGIALTIICVLVLYPFVLAVGTSLAGADELRAAGGWVLIPSEPTLEAYQVLMSGGVVTKAALVTVSVTVIGTALSMLATIMIAYGTSRPGSLGSRWIVLMMLGTFLFAPGIIPSFLMVKQLGMLDTYAALVLPVLLNAFNVIVVRQFFMNVPNELLDAARMDGATDMTILRKVILPLSKAVLAVVGLFYAVSYWNAFFNAMLYVQSDKYPLQMILRSYIIEAGEMNAGDLGIAHLPPGQAIKMAVLVCAVAPIVCVYPFLQKYFVKGVLTGAIKG
ncbi:carbohydrate ABC transporter permease [Nonomuraea sp. NPDC059007]|uniref:carbohydrate ABC transporter permease n=1 Tax=Nonomuraea sp. NPDC059007 TaxID=3346692 RepID=UPI0036AA105F